ITTGFFAALRMTCYFFQNAPPLTVRKPSAQITNNERRGNISVTSVRSTALADERNPADTGAKPQNKITPMKIPQPPRGARTQGFTLIELLVVISIIAILAGFAMPVFSNAQKRAHITETLNNA